MTTGVYFKECGDFEKDKRKLIEFVKKYSSDVEYEMKWIQKCYKDCYSYEKRYYCYLKPRMFSFKFSTYPPEDCEDITNKLCKCLGEL